jgi:hypothetical protein
MVLSIPEPQMQFAAYPVDEQNFSIIMQSFSFDSAFLTLSFIDNVAVTTLSNAQTTEPTIDYNPLWSYQSYSSYILNAASPSVTDPSRSFYTAYVNLIFKRQSQGTVTTRAGLELV